MERYGVVHFSGWKYPWGRYWREGWRVFDRAYGGQPVAVYERTFVTNKPRYRELPYPPSEEILSELRREAKLDARRRNVEERRCDA